MSGLQTIYIQNINEKIKLDELKEALYYVFSTRCGPILEVSVRANNKYRGQAWITFTDALYAAKAVETMVGFKFYDKTLRVAFSKNKADIIAKADGTYVPKEERETKSTTTTTTTTEVAKRTRGSSHDAEDEDRPHKAQKVHEDSSIDDTTSKNEPNQNIFVTGLPAGVKQLMVEKLFGQVAGLKSVELSTSRPGTAFVEYETIEKATEALNAFDGFKLAEDTLQIVFAK